MRPGSGRATIANRLKGWIVHATLLGDDNFVCSSGSCRTELNVKRHFRMRDHWTSFWAALNAPISQYQIRDIFARDSSLLVKNKLRYRKRYSKEQ